MQKLNIQHCDQSPGLNARKIWAMLSADWLAQFNKPLSTHDWDSFLCDLYTFEALLDIYAVGGRYEFYWIAEGAYTAIREYNLPTYGGLNRKITVVRGEEIVIEEIAHEVLDFSGLNVTGD